jgi:type I restriction enzyme, R subunit
MADYVLEYRNTKLAVVEAKGWNEALTLGLAEAKNYAGKLAVRFAYATNGQGIYGVDMQTGAEAEAIRLPTPDELWARTFAHQDEWRDRFAQVPYEDKGGSHPGRYYQDIAIERVLQAVASKKQRILLTLATGTGKTFIAFQIAWKLFHARWNLSREPTRRPRILFLADRNILADQAYNAFSAFPEDALVRIKPEDIRKKGKVPKNGSPLLHDLPEFHERSGRRRPADHILRRVSARLLRLHRHRRMSQGRRERREQLARHHGLLRARSAVGPYCHAETARQC